MGWPDDIIGQGTIDDSGLPKIKNWWGSTVKHVIRTDGGWNVGTYTPWDEDELYVDWERDPVAWDCRVRACMETDGKPDYDGTPVLYDKRWIKKKQRDPLAGWFSSKLLESRAARLAGLFSVLPTHDRIGCPVRERQFKYPIV